MTNYIKLKNNTSPKNMLLIVETFIKLSRERGKTLNVMTHKEGMSYGWLVHPKSMIVPCMWSDTPSHGFTIDLRECLYTVTPLLKAVVNKVPFFSRKMWHTKPHSDREKYNNEWKQNVLLNLHRFKSTGSITLAK